MNTITSLVVDSLYNSPYKGYYKKEYLAILDRLYKMGTGYFENWMVDEFVTEIVGGTDVLLKRYAKLGKSKKCAVSMLEHYIFWAYEIGNTEEGDRIKKAFEETTGLKYNKKKVADIIRFNTTSKTEEKITSNKAITITITPPKNLDKNKILKFNVEGTIEPLNDDTVVEPKRSNFLFFLFIFILLFVLVVVTFKTDIYDFAIFISKQELPKLIKSRINLYIPVFKKVIEEANLAFNRIY